MKFTYTGIRVRNLERSIKFYKEIMKMRIIQKGKMEAGGIYVQLKSERSPQVLELNYYPPGTKFYEEYVAGSELDHLAFWCKDVRKEYRRLVDSGATPAVEPWDEDGYTLAFVKDPDGLWIELIAAKSVKHG